MPWMYHVSGRYYWSQVGTGAQGAVATPAVNTLYGQPFFVPFTRTYDRISVHQTTQSVGNAARLGIYNDSTGTPGSLVLDAGTISQTGTGAKEITISQSLSPGWYWLAYVANTGAGVFEGWTATASCLGWLGCTTTTGTNANPTFVSVAFAYAALPDPFTGGSALANTNTGCMKIMLRAE